MFFFSLRAAEKTEESVSLLEKVLGHTDAHAVEVKARAKVRAVCSCVCICLSLCTVSTALNARLTKKDMSVCVCACVCVCICVCVCVVCACVFFPCLHSPSRRPTGRLRLEPTAFRSTKRVYGDVDNSMVAVLSS